VEGGDERGVRGIVYVLGNDASGKDIRAFWASESGDSMFTVCDESGDDVGADVSSSLWM
jgi:hypothetical protein